MVLEFEFEQATPRLSPKKAAAAAALDGDVVSAAAPLLATLLELRCVFVCGHCG